MDKVRSVDGLITNVENQMLDNMAGSLPKETNKIEIIEDAKPANDPVENDDHQETEYEEAAVDDKSISDHKNNDKEQSSNSGEVDEYGTAVPKSKTYTEEEVQNMIKKRVKESHNRPQMEQSQQAAQSFEHDSDSDIPWEQQLESHIEKTINKIQQKEVDRQWKDKQNTIQADFESKFTSGMEKYTDFRDVVSTAPITDSMMMATRSMNNPAAFIYAASKNHAEELSRISKIDDPFTQAREIGNLESKMIKNKKITSAPRPINTPQGDMPGKATPKRNIDSLIQKDAERMVRARR